MKKENGSHKLNRREALMGLTGFAAATPLLGAQDGIPLFTNTDVEALPLLAISSGKCRRRRGSGLRRFKVA